LHFSFYLCSCKPIQQRSNPLHPDYLNQTKSIDSLLKIIYSDSLPGASIAIIKDNKPIFQKSYGVTNVITKQNIDASSNFNICSLTKQFTAVAILQLEEKHLLSLDDKLSRFFPEMNKKVADVITIQQLLTHSSGIIDHYDYTNTENMKHAHDSDVYNAIKNIDSTYFIPGTQFRYSNTAYCLLALIIEKLSGMSYNECMKENIFKPAGMANTVIWNEIAAIKTRLPATNGIAPHMYLRHQVLTNIYFFQRKAMVEFTLQ
jgi:CubicO group peptidase (beta-lactamase class C family)